MRLLLTALLTLIGGVVVADVGANADRIRAMDQFIRGTIADEVQDYYRAVFHYQEALRYDSSAAFIYVTLAQDYVLLGNPAMASELLDKALTIDPRHVSALELKTALYRAMGNREGARQCLRQLNEHLPDNTDYLRQLLSVELDLKNWDAADKAYLQLLDRGGVPEMVTRQVLAAYLANGEFARALRHLFRLYEADTNDAQIVYALGTTLVQVGDTLQGLEYMRRANRLNPAEPKFWMGLMVTALDQRQDSTAVAIAESALARLPVQPAALYHLRGNALLRLNRTTEAIASLKQALAIDSTAFTVMGALALIYDRLDSVPQAEDLYVNAIRLSDSAAVYLNNLAYTYAVRGLKLDRALFLVERALEKDPENGSYLDTKGWILFRLNRHEEALEWLKRSLKRSPDNAEVLEHLGDVYTALKARQTARKYYLRALKLNPENELLREKAGK